MPVLSTHSSWHSEALALFRLLDGGWEIHFLFFFFPTCYLQASGWFMFFWRSGAKWSRAHWVFSGDGLKVSENTFPLEIDNSVVPLGGLNPPHCCSYMVVWHLSFQTLVLFLSLCLHMWAMWNGTLYLTKDYFWTFLSLSPTTLQSVNWCNS
jgi:hypothetical protein